MKLKISADLSLPIDAVTQTFAVIARKRVGKTYTASVLAEEFIEAKIPIVVLDPTGAWWGLRASADGKAEGYPVVIIGGSHADVPLEETAGNIIADLVVDHPGFYIIDFSQIESDAAIQRFATSFAKRFYFRKEQKRFAIHVFIDEADVFIPQNPFNEEKKMLHAFDVIVRRGGIRGIGCTMISQRPAVLNKNVLTQCETLFALQLSGSQDVDAIEHWMRIHGTKEQKQEFLSTIGSLQMGVAWFWSPSWLQKFERIHIRARRTFNSSATPKAGEKTILPAKLAAVDIEKLGAEIKATIELAKANDPKELKLQNGKLKAEILKLQNLMPAAGKVEIKEVPVLTAEDRKFIEQAVGHFESIRKTISEYLGVAQHIVDPLNRLETRASDKFLSYAKNISALQPRAGVRQTVCSTAKPAPVIRRPVPHQRDAVPDLGKLGSVESSVSGGMKRMMIALAQRPLLTKRQLGVRSGLSSTSGTFGTYLGKLRANGWIAGSDELSITQSGMDALGSYEPLPEGQFLLNYWLGELGESGAGRMLRVLAENYPNAMTKEELGAGANISHSSGTFGTYLGKLRNLELVPCRGELTASDEFFQ